MAVKIIDSQLVSRRPFELCQTTATATKTNKKKVQQKSGELSGHQWEFAASTVHCADSGANIFLMFDSCTKIKTTRRKIV